ncbi:olfactory receptor 5V1-like, partial [Heterocephalus glaber]|uniref:Olfactory receptor n=1 Tax=Heterocephalus glaber TaxID=10181 RepID=A0AAX6QU11_HETGA
MDIYNVTSVTQFILIGLSDLPKVRYPLFVAFAIIYQVTLVGNGAILLAIGTEKKLHTPMYFFLGNLSLLDIFCPSTTVPKMLYNLLTEDHSISFVGCALQLYFLVALAGTEVFLLAVMAYDRYVAICFPLHYSVIITKARCAQLVSGTWAAGFLNSTIHTMSTFSLSFCKSNLVNQYYCDIPPVVALSCSSTYVAEMLVLVVAGISGFISFLTTLISYVYIISTILKIQSAEGKHKAFSTCASHLVVVCLFYGTAIFTYIRPSSSRHSPARDRLI